MKLRNGLLKINGMIRKISEMSSELEKVTELISKHTKESEELFNVITKYNMKIDNQKKEIHMTINKIKEDELKCQEMYDIALSEMKLIIAKLEEATNVSNIIV
jgi:predicted nuclease with TOPRIM domain